MESLIDFQEQFHEIVDNNRHFRLVRMGEFCTVTPNPKSVSYLVGDFDVS